MDSNVQIKYSRKQLRYALVFGIIWIGIFILYTIFRPDSYFGYAYLVTAILFLILYVYKKVYHYATIKNGILTKNGIVKKRVALKNITDVEYFAGKYRLKSKDSEISINTLEIDEQSLKDLKTILDHLNIKP